MAKYKTGNSTSMPKSGQHFGFKTLTFSPQH